MNGLRGYDAWKTATPYGDDDNTCPGCDGVPGCRATNTTPLRCWMVGDGAQTEEAFSKAIQAREGGGPEVGDHEVPVRRARLRLDALLELMAEVEEERAEHVCETCDGTGFVEADGDDEDRYSDAEVDHDALEGAGFGSEEY